MTSKTKRTVNAILTAVFIAFLTVFIITFAIGLPIYCRFFYYIQINTLNLPAEAAMHGIDADYYDIKAAYDGILDFCTLPNKPFYSGKFKMSADGVSHFADCKKLFDLNLALMIVSGAVSLTLVLLNRFKVITMNRPMGHRAYFLSAIIALALPVIIGALAAIDFDKAFEVFHKIFFPGKDNWTFNPRQDQIIAVMPQQFFVNCAIIIGAGLAAFSAALIAADLILFKKEKKHAEKA